MRIVVFGLCENCRSQPDAVDRAQQIIFDQAAAGLARPEAN